MVVVFLKLPNLGKSFVRPPTGRIEIERLSRASHRRRTDKDPDAEQQHAHHTDRAQTFIQILLVRSLARLAERMRAALSKLGGCGRGRLITRSDRSGGVSSVSFQSGGTPPDW